jgi:hypothetical protein
MIGLVVLIAIVVAIVGGAWLVWSRAWAERHGAVSDRSRVSLISNQTGDESAPSVLRFSPTDPRTVRLPATA